MKKATAFITLVILLGTLIAIAYLYKAYPAPQDFSPLLQAAKDLVKESWRVPLLAGFAVAWFLMFLLSVMVLFSDGNAEQTEIGKLDEEKNTKAIEELQKKLTEVTDNAESLKKEISLSKEKYNAKEEECVKLNSVIEAVKAKIKETKESAKLKSQEEKHAEDKTAKEIEDLRQQIDELTKENARLDSENKDITKEAKKNSSELEAMIEKVKSSEEKQKTYKKDAEKAKSSSKALLAELNEVKEKLKEVMAELKTKQQELDSAVANSRGGSNAIPPAAFQILYLLQKEGRLIDLLMEDITDFDDETLGGAIRPIHEGCKKLLQDRLIIEHVLNEEEGDEVTIEKLDPETVKLSGNVPAEGPYTGELIHRGWRLKECHLPELVDGWSGNVVAPAEIEII